MSSPFKIFLAPFISLNGVTGIEIALGFVITTASDTKDVEDEE